jgi:hypothetical protein
VEEGMRHMTVVTNLRDFSSLAPEVDELRVDFESQPLGRRELDTLFTCLQGRRVTQLNLSHCDIDDESARLIATAVMAREVGSYHLMHVDLSYNQIADEGAEAIGYAIKARPKVTFALNHNLIGPTGAEAIVRAVAQVRTEHSVNLRGNRLGDEGAYRIAEVLNETPGIIDHLALQENQIKIDGDRALAERVPPHIAICYRTERISLKDWVLRHSFVATACVILLFPFLVLLFPFLPFIMKHIRVDDDVDGTITHRGPRRL